MNALRAALVPSLVGLCAGILMSCGGGGYGGGGSGRGPASLTLSVSPSTITLGESATITWNSNAPCTASGAWSGSKPASGSETVTPTETGSFTYTLVCRGDGYGESETESATLTVEPATTAALVVGEGCCEGLESFSLIGIATDTGESRFLVLDTHYVGRIGAAQAAFETSDSSLAGRRMKDPNAFKLDANRDNGALRLSVNAPRLRPRAQGLGLAAQPFSRRFDAAAVAGTYTTNLGTGYTLTITLDSTGQVAGSDTRGCTLQGRATTPHAAARYQEITLEISRCGDSDGWYRGHAAPVFDGSGRAAELFLSASNAHLAIGWRLSR